MKTKPLTRRDLLVAGGVLAVAAGTVNSRAAPAAVSGLTNASARHDPLGGLRIDDPAFNVQVIGKLQGDLSGRQRCIYNPGFLFAVGPSGAGQAPDDYGKLLLQLEGCTLRISRQLADGSVEERSESWMFFCDPHTGEYLTEWRNPFSGELLQVPPFRGGPGATRLTPHGPVLDTSLKLESTALDQPVRLRWRVMGPQVWLSRHAASRITAPEGQPRNEFSVDSWVCQLNHLTDSRRSWIPSTYAWTSHGEWPRWFKLAGRPGNVIWRVESLLLDDPAELPSRFVGHTQALLPGKLTNRLRFDTD